MFTSRLVRESDALLQFEVLSWLIRRYGPPARPAVPSPLHKSPPLEALVWSDQDSRSVHDWADDVVGIVRAASDAEDVPISLTTDPALAGALFYDPDGCSLPGYMTVQTALHIAELRTHDIRRAFELELDALGLALVQLCAASYSRQGFVLANRVSMVSEALFNPDSTRNVPVRLVENALCFSTCLALRARKQTAEQIIATYGSRMNKRFRRKVRQACIQIDGFESELKTLQMIAEPIPVRARAGQRRASFRSTA